MRLLIALVFALVAALPVAAASAQAVAEASPTVAGESAGAPRMVGWLEKTIDRLETEGVSDVGMAPEIPDAFLREWRSFDRNGSALAVFVDIGWAALAALVALLAERAIARGLSRRPRRRMHARETAVPLIDVLALLACDAVGLVGFVAVFGAAHRHWLGDVGVTPAFALFAANILYRWRITSLILRVILRPSDPAARLIDLSDGEAISLTRFISIAVLVIIALVGFGRHGLMDEDSGAGHVIGLIIALIICVLYALIIIRARRAGEALIRGRRSSGLIAWFRDGVARVWVPLGLALTVGLFVTFVAGLSLGLLGYYHAMSSTLGILFVLMVLDRLTEWGWRDPVPGGARIRLDRSELAARAIARILRAISLVIGATVLGWVWTEAIEMSVAGQESAMRSVSAAVGTLFVAFVAWELVRLAIDRHLQASGGPSLPGVDDDDAAAPASRLQTVLPLLRAAFAVSIGVLAALIVLSRLGVDTAPLIAGAGVFGLAVSFGSQSLVRDIISGLFYMWDDAFRVGEYIDTGRLKGTVETLGIRSVKLRHQNGPLHTIPYGQLGAVTNLSRDFATIKFNLRFEPRTDIDVVRKTTKQIGLAMQDDPEIAAEIMLPLKLQGVAEIADNAVVLRFKFTARPVKPSWVQREYLKRMVAVFAEKHIRFASGALMLQTLSSTDVPDPSVGGTAGATTSGSANANALAASAAAMAETAS